MQIYHNNFDGLIERKVTSMASYMPHTHIHNKYEIYFVEKGKTKYFVSNEIYILEDNDMIFIPKDVFHKTSNEGNKCIERLLISFNSEFISAQAEKYIHELTENKFIRIPNKHISKIKDVLYKLESEENNKTAHYEEMQKLYLHQLLILISRHRTKENCLELSPQYMVIRDAVQYISTNCNIELTLNNLASQFNMSPNYFSKQFKHITGMGVSEYINISRITMAEKLLAKTKLSVTEIATKCGYNDSNYFASVFKKLKGITPKKYSMLYKE